MKMGVETPPFGLGQRMALLVVPASNKVVFKLAAGIRFERTEQVLWTPFTGFTARRIRPPCQPATESKANRSD